LPGKQAEIIGLRRGRVIQKWGGKGKHAPEEREENIAKEETEDAKENTTGKNR